VLDVQRPYRWNLARLRPGYTLDLGCGIGRNLVNLAGRGVGVDHNPGSVELARRRGLVALTPEDFRTSQYARPGAFDSLLLAHVAEHMTHDECAVLLDEYVPYIRRGGQLIVMTPQEAGYKTDASHVSFTDFDDIAALCAGVGAVVERRLSFPFPRPVGRVFPYNEFVVTARLPA
jgi:2-polyprenyl-3-methyl-5-hydroxy-6-metoxy-1,4-benzoquinol methylase